jgi:hypothetical protein
MNIRETFLDNPKNGSLQFVWESLEIIWNIQTHLDLAALFKS